MEEAILASGSEMVTVALKRIDLETETDAIISHLKHPHIHLLPNTSS
jgi:thiazole synthase